MAIKYRELVSCPFCKCVQGFNTNSDEEELACIECGKDFLAMRKHKKTKENNKLLKNRVRAKKS